MDNNQYRPTGFKVLPVVVKNILIINGLFFLATLGIGKAFQIDISSYLGLHYFQSESFKPYQFITYLFMHADFWHIFFNMFALWMFGNVLENVWGPKRFLVYYIITGIGAALVQMLVYYIQISNLEAVMTQDQINLVLVDGLKYIGEGKNFLNPAMGELNLLLNSTTVGASGAVFGILLAFGMMFPNSLIYVYFAIPVKAKWFVVFYGAMELYSGFANNPADNVAHFAHLGGMLFGFFLIIYWNKKLKGKYF